MSSRCKRTVCRSRDTRAMLFLRIGILCLAMVIGSIAWVQPLAVQAHGEGAPQLSRAEVGPYRIYVWTDPETVQTGEDLHVTVALVRPVAGQEGKEEPVLGAEIQVRLTDLERNRPPLTVQATHENALNKLFYEAQATVPRSGPWQVDLLVSGEEGAGEIGFAIQAQPADRMPQLRIAAAGGLLVVAALLLWWVFGRRSTALRQEER